jgi:hypothetical protein
MKLECASLASSAICPAEQAALEQSWREGRLDVHAMRVLAFVDRQREEILIRAGEFPNSECLLNVIRTFIAEKESIDAYAEIRDQIRAIHDEIWIRGERGEYNRSHIAQEWTSKHAATWRRWQVMKYLFVVDRHTVEILARLSSSARS